MTDPDAWAHPTCTAPSLGPPGGDPNTCSGPWTYSYQESWKDASCGPSTCALYTSCTSWDSTTQGDGVGYTVASSSVLGNFHSYSCDWSFGCSGDPLETACTDEANARRAVLVAGIQGISPQASAGFTVTGVPVSIQNFEDGCGPFDQGCSQTTTYFCELSINNYPTPAAGRHSWCGCDVLNDPPECPRGGVTTVYTAPGMPMPDVGPPSQGSSKRELVGTQTCMTADALPTTTPAEVRAKFDELWRVLQGPQPTSVAPALFTQAIVARLKLIYELWGEQLDPGPGDTDRGLHARAMYATYPDANPSCLQTVSVPVPPAGCTATSVTATRGDLIRCERLGGGYHVSQGVASIALDGCENVLTGYLDLAATHNVDTTCGGAPLRQAAAQATLQMMDKQVGEIDAAPASLGALPRQLWLLDRWYALSKRADGLGVFTTPDQQRRDTSYLLGRFWDRVHVLGNLNTSLFGLSDSSSIQDAEAAMGATAVNGRLSEQAVVTAMFTDAGTILPENIAVSGPPLHGQPLLALLGDALKPFVDDLDSLAFYHDIACQYRDCRSPNTNTPSRNAWNILASLEASPGLQTAVDSSPHALAGWKATFTAIAGKQDRLADAITQSVTGTGGLAGAHDEADVAPLARPLWTLYQHARALHDHYEATGLFDATAQNLLHGSVLQDEQAFVVSTLRGRVVNFGSKVADYEAHLIAALQADVQVMEDSAALEDLTDQRLRKAQEMGQKAANLEGLRASGEAEADAFGSLATSFADIQGALDTGAYVAVGASQVLELSAHDAKFASSRDPAAVAAHSMTSLTAGQMLVVQSTGTWKPTCALRAVSFFQPDGLASAGADLAHAEIGPEGYSLSWNGSHYAAHSNATSTDGSLTLGESVKFCQDDGILGTVWGFKPEACVYADEHVTFAGSTTDNAGADHRSTASFSTGLRLSDTPFPDAPTGSLLVVLTDPVTGAVRDTRVVHSGGTSILIEQPSTAYFVVNDKLCGDADTATVLTTTVRVMSSQAAVATAALNAMTAVLAYMRGQQDALANQGTLLTTQATLLRQQAYVKLQAQLDTVEVAALPPPLASLFDAFVTHEIVATERRIEMRAIEHALDLDLIDLRTVDDEFKSTTNRGRMQRLVPTWLIRDLDHDTLRANLDDLLRVARDDLKPILELWYPHALDSVTFGPEISALLNADVDSSIVTLANDGQKFVSALLDAYEDAKFGNKPQAPSLPVVVLSFPRPGADVSDSPWRRVDESRAKRAWDAVLAHGKARFEISPEDFYSNNGGDAVLSCTEVVPVIKSMGFFATRPGDDPDNQNINARGRTMGGFASDTQSFVTPEGPRVYQFADAVWQDFVLPVRYGESQAAFTAFDPASRQTRPVGLSPDGTFEIDFSVLDTLTNTGFEENASSPVTEIDLVIEIDSRASSAKPTWIKRCQTP